MKKLLKVENKSCKADTEQLIKVLSGALRALEKFEPEINRLNVFPVPDGDTGTNIKLTFKAMLRLLGQDQPSSIAAAANLMRQGSLLGARGNSGVILSQIIKGLCEVIAADNSLTPPILAKALENGARAAYEVVREPVEGTILTVIRDVATAAVAARADAADDFLEKLALAARVSVENTPNLLPILRESGVVDAGGYGLAIIFAGISAAWRGEEIKAELPSADVANVELENMDYAYCTEFLMETYPTASLDDFAGRLEKLGGSTLFVGDNGLYRVHIHTDYPGKVVDMATNIGSINQVKIDNLARQSQARAEELARSAAVKKIGLMALANGSGIATVLKSLGVSVVVAGGPSANPAAADFLDAINKMSRAELILLPNNKNVVLAAEQGARLSKKRVKVVPTKSIPEAIAALLAFNSEQDLETNYKAMAAACMTVKTLAITQAVRDTKSIKKGEWLGIKGEQVAVVAPTMEGAVISLLSSAIEKNDELLTIFTGNEPLVQKNSALDFITSEFPNLEVEIIPGGQELYPLIMGLE